MKRRVVDSTKRVSDQFCHPTYDKHSWLLVSLCDTKKKNIPTTSAFAFIYLISIVFFCGISSVYVKKREEQFSFITTSNVQVKPQKIRSRFDFCIVDINIRKLVFSTYENMSARRYHDNPLDSGTSTNVWQTQFYRMICCFIGMFALHQTSYKNSQRS